jgi:hypothetical protein
MRPILIPERARARRADWAPGPGVLVPFPEDRIRIVEFVGSQVKHTSSGTDLDVESGDSDLLAADSDVLGSQHGGVGRRLVTVGLDLHSSGNTGDGFTSTIGIIEASASTPAKKLA